MAKQKKLDAEDLARKNSARIAEMINGVNQDLEECVRLADQAGISFEFTPNGKVGTYTPGEGWDEDGWNSSNADC